VAECVQGDDPLRTRSFRHVDHRSAREPERTDAVAGEPLAPEAVPVRHPHGLHPECTADDTFRQSDLPRTDSSHSVRYLGTMSVEVG
jgi:hypothetical protein